VSAVPAGHVAVEAAHPLRRLFAVLVVLAVVLVAVALVSAFVGSASLSPFAIVRAIAGRASPESVEHVITLGLRLPRIAVAALAGAALAVAGVAFQGLTRNPLAEPAVLGVSQGAAFGVVLAQVFGLGLDLIAALGVTAFAFGGAVLAAGAVYLIAAAPCGVAIQTLLLAGVIVGVFFSAAITVLISVVDTNRLGGVIHWLLGNLGAVPPVALGLFVTLAAVGVWLVGSQARELNLLALGEETARQLGVATERLKVRIFAGAALLTSTVVAFAGPIGFVGLIVPHVLRSIVGQDNRILVPTAAVGGAIFLLAADTLARTIVAPSELAVGVITSFCGAPFFVYLLRSRPRVDP
jgi:iron complex transport system permease protein